MGTEVAITNFPEPKTPTTFNLEDLPFWDSEQPIPQVEVPVSLDQAKLFDSITYKMVETAAYCAFEGHNSKYDVKNFKKHLDRNRTTALENALAQRPIITSEEVTTIFNEVYS